MTTDTTIRALFFDGCGLLNLRACLVPRMYKT